MLLLRLYLVSQLNSEPMLSIVEQTLQTDLSTMQTINPTLAFPNASTTISESFSYGESYVMDSEDYPISLGAGISST